MSDEFDRTLAERLRHYEASVPAASPTGGSRRRANRSVGWSVLGFGTAALVAATILAVVLLTPPTETVGDGTPSASPASSVASSVDASATASAQRSFAGEPSAEPTATPTPSAPASDVADPAFATPQIRMRAASDQTLQYVIGFGNGTAGRVAAVSIADYATVPATAPRPGRSAIFLERQDGSWELLDTGTTFEGVDLVHVVSPPGRAMVAYGLAADNMTRTSTGVWTSTDGRTWAEVDATWLGASPYSVAPIVGGPMGYVQAGTRDDAIQVYWSSDALNWELVHEVEGGFVSSAGAGPEGFVVMAYDGERPLSLASGDGHTWFESPVQPAFTAHDTVQTVAPVGPDWVAAGWRAEESDGIDLWWSADGLNWEAAGSVEPETDEIEPFGSRVMYAAHLLAAGDVLLLSGAWAVEGTETRPLWTWASTDGRTWEVLDLGANPEVRAVDGTGCCLRLGGRLGRETGEAVIWRWDPPAR